MSLVNVDDEMSKVGWSSEQKVAEPFYGYSSRILEHPLYRAL